MRTRSWRRKLVVALYVLVAVVTLANVGCLLIAAGAASGAAAGYFYYQGKVCQNYGTSMEQTLAATHLALAELGMPVTADERTATEAIIESRTGQGDKVRIYLETQSGKIPADGTVTRVCVRVGTFGDDAVSGRILNGVAAHLGQPMPAGPPPDAATTSAARIVPTATANPPRPAPPPGLPAQTGPPPLAN